MRCVTTCRTYNQRLLDYVSAGGNLIVLYNTFELVPNQFAPFPGTLLRTAEEVSEENSPVTILAPTHRSVQLAEQDHAGGLRRLGRTARLEVLHHVGRGLHADDLDVRQRPGAAVRRLAHRAARQGHLDVLRVRAPPAASLRRAGGVSDYGESVGVGKEAEVVARVAGPGPTGPVGESGCLGSGAPGVSTFRTT